MKPNIFNFYYDYAIQADLIEPKNNATRREGVTAADHEQGESCPQPIQFV